MIDVKLSINDLYRVCERIIEFSHEIYDDDNELYLIKKKDSVLCAKEFKHIFIYNIKEIHYLEEFLYVEITDEMITQALLEVL